MVPGTCASLLPVLQWMAGRLYAYPGIFDGFDSPPVIFFLYSMFIFVDLYFQLLISYIVRAIRYAHVLLLKALYLALIF